MIKQAELELCYQQGVQAAFEKVSKSFASTISDTVLGYDTEGQRKKMLALNTYDKGLNAALAGGALGGLGSLTYGGGNAKRHLLTAGLGALGLGGLRTLGTYAGRNYIKSVGDEELRSFQDMESLSKRNEKEQKRIVERLNLATLKRLAGNDVSDENLKRMQEASKVTE